SLAAGGALKDARLAIELFAVSGVFVYAYYSFVILNAAGVSWQRALRVFAIGIAQVAPIAVLLLALKLARTPVWIELVAASLSLVVFYAIAIRRDPALRVTVRSLPARCPAG